jgi:hypothetical protein
MQWIYQPATTVDEQIVQVGLKSLWTPTVGPHTSATGDLPLRCVLAASPANRLARWGLFNKSRAAMAGSPAIRFVTTQPPQSEHVGGVGCTETCSSTSQHTLRGASASRKKGRNTHTTCHHTLLRVLQCSLAQFLVSSFAELCCGDSAPPAGFAVPPRWISGSELLARRSRVEQCLTRLWFIGHGLLKAKRYPPSRTSQPLDLTLLVAGWMSCCTRNFMLVSAAPRPSSGAQSITETGSHARPTRRGNHGVLVTHHAFRPLRM